VPQDLKLTGEKFEDGIVRSEIPESFRRRAGRNGEIALDGTGEAIEIKFEEREFFFVGKNARAIALEFAPSLESEFARSFQVPDPLGASARSDKILFAICFDQIHRRGMDAAGIPSTNLEKVVVFGSEAESNQEAKSAVKEFFKRLRFAESRQRERFRHENIVAESRGKR
jgi:hypothetical protein